VAFVFIIGNFNIKHKGGNMPEKENIVLNSMKEAGKPVRPGEVAELTGLPKDEVSKIIQTLKKDGKVMSPKRCFWAPAE